MHIKLFSRRDLEAVLEMPRVIEGVKAAYKLKVKGDTAVWPLIEHHFTEKEAVMDIRSGGVFGSIGLHGLKMLNKFPQNAERNLPVFTGILMVCDSDTGLPLGVMDASYITCMRTGAAGAIGAQALARPDSQVLLVLGAGTQAIFQIAAALTCFPGLKEVLIADPLQPEHARQFADSCRGRLKTGFAIDCPQVSFAAAGDLAQSVGRSDIILTVTPAREPVILKEWVRPGTHFSCVGADMAGKEEIDPQLFADARVYADDLDQCLRVGEMELPYKSGIITRASVAGEIGQVLAGTVPGRQSDSEITIFDATGLAILDLVTAKSALESAAEKNLGVTAEI